LFFFIIFGIHRAKKVLRELFLRFFLTKQTSLPHFDTDAQVAQCTCGPI